MISRSKSDGASPSAAQLPIPDTIGRYVVLDRLATGGMAEVFICVERQLAGLERLAVVKRILPHLAVHETFVEMFLAEARYVARIAHPNVVAIHELGEDTGLPFLSMEYVAGCSLRDLLVAAIESDRPLPIGVALGLAIQAAAGAHAAHELKNQDNKPLGLVHRDISPHNLMVTGDGHVKLLDFGIAKATEASGIENTRTGALKGKVHYMAPEQCKQEPLDRRADVFALGIVAWELLASERLFKRDSELEAMQAIVSGDLRDLKRLRSDTPPCVIDAVTKALVPQKESRYQTAEAMKKALVEAAATAKADTSSEAIAAFLGPLLGKRLAERHQSFLDAARRPRPPRDLGPAPGRQKTGTFSRSSFDGDDGAGDSTVADKPPSRRHDRAPEPKDALHPPVDDDEFPPPRGGNNPYIHWPKADEFSDLADMQTVRDRGPVNPARPRDADTDQTNGSLPALPALPAPPAPSSPRRGRQALLAAGVALFTCAVVTAALLLPRLRGPRVTGAPIVVSYPPTVAPDRLVADLELLEHLLEERTGRPVEIRLAGSYDSVLAELKNNNAAFAVLPPFLFLTARRELPGLVPLATKLVDGSAGSDGVILVREDSAVTDVASLKGKTFCFPDKRSATGYVLARAKLFEAGLDPDVDLTPHISGNHTQVMKDLTAGVCDAGATYSGGYLAADRAGIPVGRARVLTVTGRSPQDMVVASPTAASADRALLGEALLTLDPKASLGTDTVGVLERVSGFTVPRLADYDALEKAIERAKL